MLSVFLLDHCRSRALQRPLFLFATVNQLTSTMLVLSVLLLLSVVSVSCTEEGDLQRLVASLATKVDALQAELDEMQHKHEALVVSTTAQRDEAEQRLSLIHI